MRQHTPSLPVTTGRCPCERGAHTRGTRRLARAGAPRPGDPGMRPALAPPPEDSCSGNLVGGIKICRVEGVLRTLSVEEMAEYRRPFAEPGEGRRPTLSWPREILIEGEPADVAAIAAAYADWLATSGVPKLFVKGKPGAVLA